MPKSIYKQISNPRETYVDGYGVTREIYEPKAITVGRNVYNGISRFFNGMTNEEHLEKFGIPAPTASSGILGLLGSPVANVSRIKGVAKLSEPLSETEKLAKDLAFRDMSSSGMPIYRESEVLAMPKRKPIKSGLETANLNSYRGYTTRGRLEGADLSVGNPGSVSGQSFYSLRNRLSSQIENIDKAIESRRAYMQRNPQSVPVWMQVELNELSMDRNQLVKELSKLQFKSGGKLNLPQIKKHQAGGTMYYDTNWKDISYTPYDIEMAEERVPEPYQIQGYFPEVASSSSSSSATSNDEVKVAPIPTYNTPAQTTSTNVGSSKKGKTYSDKNQFVSEMTSAYEKALKSRGINPEYAKYLAIQDAHESNFGKSFAGNWNYGNITVGSDKNASYTEGKDHDASGKEIVQKFRNYSSLDDYVNRKIDLLSGNIYNNAFNGDANKFYERLVNGKYKYAEDPRYVSKLTELYNQYA